MVDTEQLVEVWIRAQRSIGTFEAQLRRATAARDRGEATEEEVDGLAAVLEAHRTLNALVLKRLAATCPANALH